MIVLRCINDLGEKFDLDLFQNEDLRLDISAIESTEIGEVFGVSSQTFALPATDNNNKFFGNLYDLGATPATSFTKTIPCQVLYNGARVFKGKMYLQSVITDNKGDTIYNIIVVNEVVDFKFQIQDKTLADLDWSSYNHNLTMTNVTSSWEDNLFSGDIKYPLVNYGVDVEDTFSTSIEAGGNAGMFDNSTTPLRAVDFRPTIKAKAVVDKIFDSVNYRYSSSFFNSDYFNNLYILATQTDGGNQFTSPVTSSLDARVGSTQNINNNNPAIINFTTEIFDNGGNWSTNEYTAPTDGDYTFYAQLNFGNITGTRPVDAEYLYLQWWDPVGAVVLAETLINIVGTNSPQVYIGPTTLNLAAGDKVSLLATISTNPVYSANYPILTGKITIDGAPTKTGGPVNMAYIWGDDAKITDFLDGIIQKFNLVFEPLVTERNTIVVEPFNDWVDDGEVVDWTDKVDYSQKFEITHPLQEQPKSITFTDLEDSDAINSYHKTRTGNIYGQYNYLSDSDLAVGEKTVGAFFSPTPMKYIDGATTMIVPAIAQRQEGRLVPYKFNPRLLYDVGIVSGSSYLRGYNTSAQTYDYGKYWILKDDGSVEKKAIYPLFHHLSLEVNANGVLQDATDQTIDLHFGNKINPGHWSYHQKQYNAYTKLSAFYQYWSFYINELYDVDSRKVTLNVKFNPTEIQDLRLNQKIHIDGHYYRIDKINGANLLTEDSVPVTLLKTLPRKLRFPRRRISVNDIYVDVTVDDQTFTQSGQGVQYIDYETGVVISGSVAEQAATKDGFSSYEGGDQIVWRIQSPDTFTLTSQDNFGNNEVRISANKVNITGENNTIKEQVRQVNILGESNDIGEYAEYSTIAGNNHTIGFNTSNLDISGQNHIIDNNVSFATILGGTNAYIKGGIIGSGSFNAILNTDEGNIYEGRYNTLMGGFGGRIESSSFSTMIGENHYISSSKSTILVNNVSQGAQRYFTNMTESVIMQVSKDMDGSDYPTEKLYVGDTYFTEEIAEDFYVYTGSFASPLDLDDDAYSGIYSFILTPTGTGDLEVILPPCGNITDRGYRRKLKFTTQNRSGATFKFSTTGADTFYVDGSPSSYDFNFLGASITFVAAKVGPANVWIIEEQTRGSKINEGAYGSFYSTGSQTIAASGSAQMVTMGNTFASKFVSLSGSGTIEMDYAGAYSFSYTAKVQNAANDAQYADFWIKYNGTDYPNSTVRVTIPARKSATEFFTSPVTVQLLDVAVNDGDKIELWWRGDSTELSLQYETFGGAIPAQPSVRAVIHEV